MPRLVSCPALAVEDQAAAAGGTDEPLPPARVAEPERPAADGARGHHRAVAGTHRLLPRRHGGQDRLLLGGIELGLLLRHGGSTAVASISTSARDSTSPDTITTDI